MSAPVLAQYDPERPQLGPLRFAATVAAAMVAPLVIGAAYAGEDVVDPLADVQMGRPLRASAIQPPEPAIAHGAGVMRRLRSARDDRVASWPHNRGDRI